MTAVPNEQQAQYWTEQGGPEWVRNESRYDAMLSALGDDVLRAADLRPGERVLDVGCGFGSMTIEAAKAVAPDGVVLGVDISSPMIERAIAKAAGTPNVEFTVDDGQTMERREPPFDVVVSRMGVMFFDDPVAAFANLASGTTADARLAFACWQALADNRWMGVVAEVFAPYLSEPLPIPPPRTPGPMAFAEADYVTGLLEAAGWGHVELAEWRRPLTISSDGVEGAVQRLLSGSVGRMASQLLPDADRQEALDALREEIATHLEDSIVTYDGAAWIVTAQAQA
jgi:SAM-dependent methyltransferase